MEVAMAIANGKCQMKNVKWKMVVVMSVAMAMEIAMETAMSIAIATAMNFRCQHFINNIK